MSGVVVICCRAATARPATTPAMRPAAKRRAITGKRARALMAREGERVARVMRRVVHAFRIGEACAVNEAEAENERDEGGFERLGLRGGERADGGGVGRHDRLPAA